MGLAGATGRPVAAIHGVGIGAEAVGAAPVGAAGEAETGFASLFRRDECTNVVANNRRRRIPVLTSAIRFLPAPTWGAGGRVEIDEIEVSVGEERRSPEDSRL